jgi:metallo-beta-lactamase class B
VFSPAFWFAQQPLFQYVRQHPANPDTRFYFVCGTTESQTMLPLMQAMRDSLASSGVPAANLSFNPRADGQHAEWFWKREFSAGYRWLYAPAAPLSNRKGTARLAFSAYPTPTKDKLRVELPAGLREAKLEVLDATGRVVLKNKVRSGDSVGVGGLARGTYFLRVSAGKQAGTQTLVKE